MAANLNMNLLLKISNPTTTKMILQPILSIHRKRTLWNT